MMIVKFQRFFGAVLIGLVCATAHADSFTFSLDTGYSIETYTISRDPLFWDQMNAAQRAQLWPVLSHEQKLAHWRLMSKNERRELRQALPEIDNKEFKKLFVSGKPVMEIGELTNLMIRQMSPEDKEVLKNQILEFNRFVEHGLPFICDDPLDCQRIHMR